MTQHTVPHTRAAPQRRPGVRKGSSWRVPLALVVLSLIPVVSGSLRLIEVAGGPQLMPTNPRIDASPALLVVHEWVIRRPSVRRAGGAHRAGRARTRAALAAL
jgi:hypothetical protein